MKYFKLTAAIVFVLMLLLSALPVMALSDTETDDIAEYPDMETELPELPSWYPEDISSWTWT